MTIVDPLQIAHDCLESLPPDPAAATMRHVAEIRAAAERLGDVYLDVIAQTELNGIAIGLGLTEGEQLMAELRWQIARHERCSRAHALLDQYLRAIAEAASPTDHQPPGGTEQ